MISDQDMNVLKNSSTEQLADYWAEFNRYETPPIFLKDDERDAWEIMCWIMERVPRKERMRAWNVNSGNMTEEEFEAWWLHGRQSREVH